MKGFYKTTALVSLLGLGISNISCGELGDARAIHDTLGIGQAMLQPRGAWNLLENGRNYFKEHPVRCVGGAAVAVGILAVGAIIWYRRNVAPAGAGGVAPVPGAPGVAPGAVVAPGVAPVPGAVVAPVPGAGGVAVVAPAGAGGVAPVPGAPGVAPVPGAVVAPGVAPVPGAVVAPGVAPVPGAVVAPGVAPVPAAVDAGVPVPNA
ncbi:MAG: hypothetical protein LBS83_00180, partial [Holosporales bacterium]|nr:hypothetical protein [Holosporales bacterium]